MSGGFPISTLSGRALEHAHDVAFFHDQEFNAVELDLGAGPFSEQHLVTDLEINRGELACLIAPTRADSCDLAGLRLFLCSVGDNDSAGGLRFGINTLDDNAVVKRAKFHGILLKDVAVIFFGSQRLMMD